MRWAFVLDASLIVNCDINVHIRLKIDSMVHMVCKKRMDLCNAVYVRPSGSFFSPEIPIVHGVFCFVLSNVCVVMQYIPLCVCVCLCVSLFFSLEFIGLFV